MGSPFNIVMYSNDSMRASHLAKQSFNLVDSFVFIFSDYIDSSELSKLSTSSGVAATPLPLSPAMFDILMTAKMAYEKSDGAFDITMGPLVKLWRRARKTKVFPKDDEVQSARNLIGFNNVIIDTVNKTVILLKKGMQLDLGGIAQGYIAQKIIDFLRSQKIDHALVNVSGDIAMSNSPPGSTGWTVGVNVPETMDELLPKTLQMQNMAVTTSGDAYQYIEHGGKRYSHIVDPRTGYGVISQRNVTAIANDGTTADWLATACSILSIKKAKKLARQLGAEVLIGEMRKGKLVLHSTKGFAVYWKQPQQ
jgi:thiamine biosynthesis lipoprotein